MADRVNVTINGQTVEVPAGTSIAAAVVHAGVPCRHSISGQPRGPLCGMGICFECRVTVNGEPHVKGCQLMCAEGMEIVTDA